MQIIPVSPIPAQKFGVVLDGQKCSIHLYWRQTRLYLDLDVSGVPVCRGRICQNKVDILLSPVRGFSGSLHFVDLEGDRPPDWVSLGAIFRLVFVAAGETLPAALEF